MNIKKRQITRTVKRRNKSSESKKIERMILPDMLRRQDIGSYNSISYYN